MDSISVPYFQLDTGSPVTLSMPEFEPSELIWRKGPAVEPLATTEEEEEVLVGEDDMAEWLRFFCDGANDVGSANLNGSQTAVGSNHSPPPVLSDFQVPPPVFLAKDAESDCNVVSSEVRRKGKEKLCSEGHSEVTNIGFNEKRKDALPKSVASRKLHATEVHNLSERRRRCRINEKMKILQDLVPASNKLDKASVLDEVIAYVKFLQMQVKMMARGCSIRPPYMQSVRSMGIGMGMMNMGNEPGMTPFGPAIPYPHINQPIQVPMLQMRHHQHNMAAAMFPYSLAGDPYRCPVVVPGQVQMFPQHLTANKKTEKRKAG